MKINVIQRLQSIQAFLMDLDGTIYLGNELLPGVLQWLEALRQAGKEVYFVSNNSSKRAIDYRNKLQSMGIIVDERQIITSGQAAVVMLKCHDAYQDVFVLGNEALQDELVSEGILLYNKGEARAVLAGFDTSLTYDKLWLACRLVASGVPYYATHPDLNCPLDQGFMPDCGAILAFIHASTGRWPDEIAGKPYQAMIQTVTQRAAIEPYRIAIIGDRLYTDIRMGINEGLLSILVLSGETKHEDIAASEYQPDLVMEDLVQLEQVCREHGLF